jgi:hypothetical protein
MIGQIVLFAAVVFAQTPTTSIPGVEPFQPTRQVLDDKMISDWNLLQDRTSKALGGEFSDCGGELQSAFNWAAEVYSVSGTGPSVSS